MYSIYKEQIDKCNRRLVEEGKQCEEADKGVLWG